MIKREIYIPCGRITLEGVVEIPRRDQNRLPAVVICHPHPLYGGTMNNNVTQALAKGLLERDFVCLRFNFRGVGRSQGVYGEGQDEIEDVLAALDYLERLEDVDPTRIVAAGYSFGCWVGLRAAAGDSRPTRLIGISPPVDEYDFGFLLGEKRPKLLIAGDRDFVCSPRKFKELLDAIPEPRVGVTLEGADHFHFGREERLVKEATLFLDGRPWNVGA